MVPFHKKVSVCVRESLWGDLSMLLNTNEKHLYLLKMLVSKTEREDFWLRQEQAHNSLPRSTI